MHANRVVTELVRPAPSAGGVRAGQGSRSFRPVKVLASSEGVLQLAGTESEPDLLQRFRSLPWPVQVCVRVRARRPGLSC